MGSSSSTVTVMKLACEASDRIASYSVGMAGFPLLLCTPERAVPLLARTGDTDRYAVSRSVEGWAEAYECDGDPVIEDLGAGVTRTAHQGCLADIVLYDVEGAGHGFFHRECVGGGELDFYCKPNEVLDQLREMELFFAEHPLSAE